MQDFMHDIVGETIFPELAETAERARWRLADIPWHAIDRELATPAIRGLVRHIAFSEQTTFTATEKFMRMFNDDLDFTQWMSVWFYEETRHPLILLRWLAELGEHCDSDFVARGRVTTPFMRSRMGTLVTNVISEVNAAALYRGVTLVTKEPVLLGLARRLCSDEARHAGSFYRYAARRLERSPNSERERVDAVKVLYFWLRESEQVTHPVNRTIRTISSDFPEIDVRERVCRIIGTLVDLPLVTPDDVDAWLGPLVAEAHAARA